MDIDESASSFFRKLMLDLLIAEPSWAVRWVEIGQLTQEQVDALKVQAEEHRKTPAAGMYLGLFRTMVASAMGAPPDA